MILTPIKNQANFEIINDSKSLISLRNEKNNGKHATFMCLLSLFHEKEKSKQLFQYLEYNIYYMTVTLYIYIYNRMETYAQIDILSLIITTHPRT